MWSVELETERAWLRVQIKVQPDGRLVVGVADDSGRRVPPQGTPSSVHEWVETVLRPSSRVELGPLTVRWPLALPEMLARAQQRLSVYRVGSPHPTTVPVFVAAPALLTLVSGVGIVETLLRMISAEFAGPTGPAPGPRWPGGED